jgi:hypothetical protein
LFWSLQNGLVFQEQGHRRVPEHFANACDRHEPA